MRRSRPADARESQKERDKEKAFEQDIERRMNKTALITLWIDPREHQIVKYTFDNVWLDFLPAGWLVKVDDIRASMTMGQPFPGVWLPRELNIHAGVTLANGSFEASATSASSTSTGWPKSRRRCGCRRRRTREPDDGATGRSRATARVRPGSDRVRRRVRPSSDGVRPGSDPGQTGVRPGDPQAARSSAKSAFTATPS